MPRSAQMRVTKVTTTEFRDRLRDCARKAEGDTVVLIENRGRRSASKYLVDKTWLDSVVRERQALLATIDVLADARLTKRLLALSSLDLRTTKLHSMAEVFGAD